MNEINGLHPAFRPWARSFMAMLTAAGVRYRLTSTLRTRQDQERLYRRFKAGLSRYPAAPPGTSTHERGLAFDINLENPRLYPVLGRIWEGAGRMFIWGGRFKDPIHFEVRPERPR